MTLTALTYRKCKWKWQWHLAVEPLEWEVLFGNTTCTKGSGAPNSLKWLLLCGKERIFTTDTQYIAILEELILTSIIYNCYLLTSPHPHLHFFLGGSADRLKLTSSGTSTCLKMVVTLVVMTSLSRSQTFSLFSTCCCLIMHHFEQMF